jgi:hypothetical protein
MMPLMGGIRHFCCPLSLDFGAVNDWTLTVVDGLWPPDLAALCSKRTTGEAKRVKIGVDRPRWGRTKRRDTPSTH